MDAGSAEAMTEGVRLGFGVLEGSGEEGLGREKRFDDLIGGMVILVGGRVESATIFCFFSQPKADLIKETPRDGLAGGDAVGGEEMFFEIVEGESCAFEERKELTACGFADGIVIFAACFAEDGKRTVESFSVFFLSLGEVFFFEVSEQIGDDVGFHLGFSLRIRRVSWVLG